MRVHITLKKPVADNSRQVDELLTRLKEHGASAINANRLARHGILSCSLNSWSEEIRTLPGVESVEIDGLKKTRTQ
jgi:hypothetical protein